MAEPPLKKLKEDDKQEFLAFLESKEKVEQLYDAYQTLFNGYSQMRLVAKHVREADARCCKSFSQATCDTLSYDDEGAVFTTGSVFEDGMRVLLEFLDKEEPKIPTDSLARSALRKLLVFLSSSHTKLAKPIEDVDHDECEMALRFAEHLLSKLTVDSNYVIDKCYPNKRLRNKYAEKFADTTFGVPDAWHGRVDILMDNLPVNLETENADADLDDTVSEASECSFEVKPTENFQKPDLNQILVHTIVFSFLQRKKFGDGLGNNLIPSVGICKNHLVVYFYDCVNDVLLASDKIEYLNDVKYLECSKDQDVFVPAIVFLWLTLNYKYFCSGATEIMKKFKSEFHQHAGIYLEKYQLEVQMPCRMIQKDHDESNKWSKFGAAKRGGIHCRYDFEGLNKKD